MRCRYVTPQGKFKPVKLCKDKKLAEYNKKKKQTNEQLRKDAILHKPIFNNNCISSDSLFALGFTQNTTVLLL